MPGGDLAHGLPGWGLVAAWPAVAVAAPDATNRASVLW
jgi:hypothetical protein